MPTEYQQTNADSYIAVAEPGHLSDTPFDYTWVIWESYGVRGYTKAVNSVRRTAWWWRFGVPLAGKYTKKGSTQAINGIHFLCRTCHTTAPTLTRPLNVTNGSQHALEHFRNVHSKSYEENVNGPLKELNKANAMSSSFDLHDPVQQRLYNSIVELFDSGLIKKDIMRWITLENIPFKKLQSPYFRMIFSRIHPLMQESIIPSEKAARQWVYTEFAMHKEEVREILKNAASRIYLSFDLWTSPRRKAINGVVANFVDDRGKCQTAMLAFREMTNCYDGKAIAANVLAVIDDYDLRDKVGFFVLDNASSNDTAVAILGETLQFDPKVRRLRCIGHILNLVAQQLLFGSDFEKFEGEIARVANLREEVKLWRAQGPIRIVATIVRWINKSSGRVKRFEDAQGEVWRRENPESDQQPPPLRLKMDNATRYVPISFCCCSCGDARVQLLCFSTLR